jgi:tetratricopeptide (TPR) repeat protein
MGAIGVLALAGIATIGAAGQDRGRPGGLSAGPRLGLIAVALAAVAAQLPTLVSVEQIRESDRELSAGDPEAAIAAADDALDAEPWSASAYASRALAERASGQPEQALDDATEAVELEPLNWRHHLLLAELHAAAGRQAEAEAAVSEAQRLAPRLALLAPESAYLTGLQQQISGQ